jgi:hypothetical protein
MQAGWYTQSAHTCFSARSTSRYAITSASAGPAAPCASAPPSAQSSATCRPCSSLGAHCCAAAPPERGVLTPTEGLLPSCSVTRGGGALRVAAPLVGEGPRLAAREASTGVAAADGTPLLGGRGMLPAPGPPAAVADADAAAPQGLLLLARMLARCWEVGAPRLEEAQPAAGGAAAVLRLGPPLVEAATGDSMSACWEGAAGCWLRGRRGEEARRPARADGRSGAGSLARV